MRVGSSLFENFKCRPQGTREHRGHGAVLDGEVELAIVEHHVSGVDGASAGVGRPHRISSRCAILVDGGSYVNCEAGKISIGGKQASNFLADLKTPAGCPQQNLTAAQTARRQNHLRRTNAVAGFVAYVVIDDFVASVVGQGANIVDLRESPNLKTRVIAEIELVQ